MRNSTACRSGRSATSKQNSGPASLRGRQAPRGQLSPTPATLPSVRRSRTLGVQLVRRSLLGALIALTVAAVIGGVGAAGTGSDPSGTMLLNGTKVFPIVLAKGPDAGTTTPDGAS